MYNDEYKNIDDNLTNCNIGSRKRRIIQDNLFLINAITIGSKQNPKEAIDINVYNVKMIILTREALRAPTQHPSNSTGPDGC